MVPKGGHLCFTVLPVSYVAAHHASLLVSFGCMWLVLLLPAAPLQQGVHLCHMVSPLQCVGLELLLSAAMALQVGTAYCSTIAVAQLLDRFAA